MGCYSSKGKMSEFTILFVGPPGVGKTQAITWISNNLCKNRNEYRDQYGYTHTVCVAETNKGDIKCELLETYCVSRHFSTPSIIVYCCMDTDYSSIVKDYEKLYKGMSVYDFRGNLRIYGNVRSLFTDLLEELTGTKVVIEQKK
jgi:DNA polymerase III delta prime subunit